MTTKPFAHLGPREVITIKELAAVVGMDRSAALKSVKSWGYRPVLRRTGTSGYQRASTLTLAQAEEIFARRRAEGYC